MSAQKIHAAVLLAMTKAAKDGIGKTATATLGGATVKYRGIEIAMNTMCAILVECGITVSGRYSDLQIIDRAKGDPKDAKATRFVTLLGTFTFSADDGSSVVASHYGEAMDSGDKAVTKAQSVAFRTALFQTFVIPTKATAIDPEDGGDGDEDEKPDPLLDEARLAADSGRDVFADWWKKAKPEMRRHLANHLDDLKRRTERSEQPA